eukprot:731344-Rhodomonas_salina.1
MQLGPDAEAWPAPGPGRWSRRRCTTRSWPSPSISSRAALSSAPGQPAPLPAGLLFHACVHSTTRFSAQSAPRTYAISARARACSSVC